MDRANPGDPMFGDTYQLGGCGHGCIKWGIYTEDLASYNCVLLQVNSYPMYSAYVTLEVYNVANCGNYPATGHTYFTSLSVGGGSPGWSANVLQNDGCGERVSVVSSSEVDLFY